MNEIANALLADVGGLVGKGLHARGRRHGDHPAAAALDHSRDEGVGEPDHCLAVDAHHLGLPHRVELEEAAAESEAGVVDKQVHVGAELLHPAGQLFRLEGEVALDDIGRGGDLLGELLEPVLSAGHQDQLVAAPGELARKLIADSGGCSGDQCRVRHESQPNSKLSGPLPRGGAGQGANIGL